MVGYKRGGSGFNSDNSPVYSLADPGLNVGTRSDEVDRELIIGS